MKVVVMQRNKNSNQYFDIKNLELVLSNIKFNLFII